MRRSFRQASPRPSALLSSVAAGREGSARLALAATASQQLWSTRGLATMPISATLREARKKLDGNGLGGIERLTAEETYEVLQWRFAEYGTIRAGFVTQLFHKAQTPAHLDRALEAFYFAQSQLVEPNEHMIWEIIHACRRAGELRRALELFANSAKYRVWPLARQFNRLMADFMAAGDHEGAVRTYGALRTRQVVPNAQTFGLLVSAHAAQGNTDQALAAAEEAKRALQTDTLPGPVADALMGVHWKAQNFEGLRSLVEQTSDTTRSLDGALYASLAHLQANNVSAAADLVRAAVTATPATAEQFEKWANTLAEEATSAHLAQPAAGLLRALTGVAPADVALEELAAQLDAEAASAAAAPAAPETTEQAAGDSEPAAAAEADGAEKKEEAQA